MMATMKNTLVAITGNTYPVKEQLKALSARWNPEDKCWMISEDLADKARAIVSGNAGSVTYTPRRSNVCKVCGYHATGKYGDIIYRSGECRDCFEERKMGY